MPKVRVTQGGPVGFLYEPGGAARDAGLTKRYIHLDAEPSELAEDEANVALQYPYVVRVPEEVSPEASAPRSVSDMTVDEIKAAVTQMDIPTLRKAHADEVIGKNRVTALEAITDAILERESLDAFEAYEDDNEVYEDSNGTEGDTFESGSEE